MEGGMTRKDPGERTNLQRMRTEKGYSQSQLAEKSGVTIKMIQKYESGERDINNAKGITIYKLAKAIECSMETLIEKENVMDNIAERVKSDHMFLDVYRDNKWYHHTGYEVRFEGSSKFWGEYESNDGEIDYFN